MLDKYTYVFAIGTFFALLDAFNNGASKYALPSSKNHSNKTQTMSPIHGLPVSLLVPSATGKLWSLDRKSVV